MLHNWGTPKDGKVPEVSLAKETKIEAENFNDGGSHYAYFKRPSEGDIKVETNNGITYLSGMKRKEWARYTIHVKEAGRYAVTCMMMQTRGGGSFLLGIDGTWVRSTETKENSANNKWETVVIPNVELQPGEHYIEWRSMNGNLNLDWISLAASVNKVPGIVD